MCVWHLIIFMEVQVAAGIEEVTCNYFVDCKGVLQRAAEEISVLQWRLGLKIS